MLLYLLAEETSAVVVVGYLDCSVGQ
jgi:hypothetical protein